MIVTKELRNQSVGLELPNSPCSPVLCFLVDLQARISAVSLFWLRKFVLKSGIIILCQTDSQKVQIFSYPVYKPLVVWFTYLISRNKERHMITNKTTDVPITAGFHVPNSGRTERNKHLMKMCSLFLAQCQTHRLIYKKKRKKIFIDISCLYRGRLKSAEKKQSV